MRTYDFLSRIKDMGLPISDGYDIISSLSGISYGEARLAESLPDEAAETALKRLSSGEPAAYITNRREFWGREFYVDENVLIPRVETEILVEEALKAGEGIDGARVLDLCTGSGCILLSILADRRDITGTGVDISGGALKIAEKNAALLGVRDRAHFTEADAASFTAEGVLYDILVCNPPYLTRAEYEDTDARIKREPEKAFVAGDNGLFFYKNILRNTSLLCKKKSAVLFEVGWTQSGPLADFAADIGVKARFVKDLSGIDRVMVCEFQS